MLHSKIEWTDHTFNPWIGCTKVAVGCEHCYAESYAKRYGKAAWGPHGTRVKTSENYWRQPLKWNREAEFRIADCGLRNRPKVFCASLADVFEDWDGPIHNFRGSELWHEPAEEKRGQTTPITMDDLRRDLFALIDATPHLDWLLLTKRPEKIRRMWPMETKSAAILKDHQSRNMWPAYFSDITEVKRLANYRPNVWLLTSISTQDDADHNIPELLKCRDLAPVLGLSCEPLLGPITLNLIGDCGTASGNCTDNTCRATIDWVIAGGESGHHARPMHPDWARSLRDQCLAAKVPFFFKQWGEWAPCRHKCTNGSEFPDGQRMWRLGKKTAGRSLDGREWSEFPR